MIGGGAHGVLRGRIPPHARLDVVADVDAVAVPAGGLDLSSKVGGTSVVVRLTRVVLNLQEGVRGERAALGIGRRQPHHIAKVGEIAPGTLKPRDDVEAAGLHDTARVKWTSHGRGRAAGEGTLTGGIRTACNVTNRSA